MIIKRELTEKGQQALIEAKKILNEASDWWAQCPKCGAQLSGTPAQLCAHRCEVTHGRDI